MQFYWTSLFYSKYFVQDCLSKQTFGHNLVQSPLNFKTFCQSLIFVLALFSIFGFSQNLLFKNLSTFIIGSFLTEPTFLSQAITFSRNLNHNWKCREQKKNISNRYIVLIMRSENTRKFASESKDPSLWFISEIQFGTINLIKNHNQHLRLHKMILIYSSFTFCY